MYKFTKTTITHKSWIPSFDGTSYTTHWTLKKGPSNQLKQSNYNGEIMKTIRLKDANTSEKTPNPTNPLATQKTYNKSNLYTLNLSTIPSSHARVSAVNRGDRCISNAWWYPWSHAFSAGVNKFG